MLNACLIFLVNLASYQATPIVDVIPTINEKGEFELYLDTTKKAQVNISISDNGEIRKCAEERLGDGWSGFYCSDLQFQMDGHSWIGPINVYVYFDEDSMMLDDTSYMLFFECDTSGCSEIDKPTWEVGVGLSTIEKDSEGNLFFVREAIQLSEKEIKGEK